MNKRTGKVFTEHFIIQIEVNIRQCAISHWIIVLEKTVIIINTNVRKYIAGKEFGKVIHFSAYQKRYGP